MTLQTLTKQKCNIHAHMCIYVYIYICILHFCLLYAYKVMLEYIHMYLTYTRHINMLYLYLDMHAFNQYNILLSYIFQTQYRCRVRPFAKVSTYEKLSFLIRIKKYVPLVNINSSLSCIVPFILFLGIRNTVQNVRVAWVCNRLKIRMQRFLLKKVKNF